MSAFGVPLCTKFFSLPAFCIKMLIDYSFCHWFDKLYPNYTEIITAILKILNFSFTELFCDRDGICELAMEKIVVSICYFVQLFEYFSPNTFDKFWLSYREDNHCYCPEMIFLI